MLDTHPIYIARSQSRGQTFGERFARSFGLSRPGDYIGMASTNEYAYPVWIGTDDQGPQVMMAKIKR